MVIRIPRFGAAIDVRPLQGRVIFVVGFVVIRPRRGRMSIANHVSAHQNLPSLWEGLGVGYHD